MAKDDKEATNFLIEKIPVAIHVVAYGSEDNKQVAIIKSDEKEALAASSYIIEQKYNDLLKSFGGGRQWKEVGGNLLVLDNGDISVFGGAKKPTAAGPAAHGEGTKVNCAELHLIFVKAAYADDFKYERHSNMQLIIWPDY